MALGIFQRARRADAYLREGWWRSCEGGFAESLRQARSSRFDGGESKKLLRMRMRMNEHVGRRIDFRELSPEFWDFNPSHMCHAQLN